MAGRGPIKPKKPAKAPKDPAKFGKGGVPKNTDARVADRQAQLADAVRKSLERLEAPEAAREFAANENLPSWLRDHLRNPGQAAQEAAEFAAQPPQPAKSPTFGALLNDTDPSDPPIERPLREILRPAGYHNANPDEWLLRRFQEAIDSGVAMGRDDGLQSPFHIEEIAKDREYIYELQKILETLGYTGLDPLGTHGLPRQGAYKVAFSSGDDVIKFGQPGIAETEKHDLPEGVWGVTPFKFAQEVPNPASEYGNSRESVSMFVQPRRELVHPTWGSPRSSYRHMHMLAEALKRQGWDWSDNHLNNLAFEAGPEYKPTVIDGYVTPRSTFVPEENVSQIPFKPPRGPNMYSVLLGLLTGAGAAAASNTAPPAPLSGLTEN